MNFLSVVRGMFGSDLAGGWLILAVRLGSGGLCDDYASTIADRRHLHLLALARGAYTIAGFDDDVFSQVRHSSSSMSHGLDLKSETCVQNDSF